MRKQQIILLSLSLAISACVLLVRGSFLPHSLAYVIVLIMSFYYELFIPLSFLNLHFIWFITIAFSILIIWSFVHCFVAFKRYRYKALIPFLANTFTVIVMLFMQYPVVLPNFHLNLSDREAVVAMVNSGKLIPQESDKIKILIPKHPYRVYKMKLPSKYAHLSHGVEEDGEINVLFDQDDRAKMVVFFNTVGRLKGQPDYTAFVYKPNADKISHEDIFGVANLQFYVGILEEKKLKDNWFWVDVWED